MELLKEKALISHPSSIIISGMSMSGKSVFTQKLVNDIEKIFYPVPSEIILSYSEDQPLYHNFKRNDIKLFKGLDIPLNENSNPKLLIIDDQMNSCNDQNIQSLFVKGVHHSSTSVIYITQNLYNSGRFARDIRLNCHYMFIFKSPTYTSQIQYLNRQLFPRHKIFLFDAYKKATSKPYSYLLVILHPECSDDLRVRSGILPSEDEIIYIPT